MGAGRDATSLGAAGPAGPPELIVQVQQGVAAQEMSYRGAIREALREEMERDGRVFLMGEDIGEHGGAFGVTRTLWEQFGFEWVWNTVVSDKVMGSKND